MITTCILYSPVKRRGAVSRVVPLCSERLAPLKPIAVVAVCIGCVGKVDDARLIAEDLPARGIGHVGWMRRRALLLGQVRERLPERREVERRRGGVCVREIVRRRARRVSGGVERRQQAVEVVEGVVVAEGGQLRSGVRGGRAVRASACGGWGRRTWALMSADVCERGAAVRWRRGVGVGL